jgi:hypothetical protein
MRNAPKFKNRFLESTLLCRKRAATLGDFQKTTKTHPAWRAVLINTNGLVPCL